jgi:hypothetical protein
MQMKQFFIILNILFISSLNGQQVIVDDIYVLLPNELLVKNNVKKIIHHDQYSTNRLNEITLRPDGKQLTILTAYNKRRDTIKTLTTFFYDDHEKLIKKITINQESRDTLLYQTNKYENGNLEIRKFHMPNGLREEKLDYNSENKLLSKTISYNEYFAIQEYDDLERTIKYSRKYAENDVRLETSLEYKKDTVLIFQFHKDLIDTTIVELNENGFPLYSGSKGVIASHREQYLYNENGLIKSIIHRRKPKHTFKYELRE